MLRLVFTVELAWGAAVVSRKQSSLSIESCLVHTIVKPIGRPEPIDT